MQSRRRTLRENAALREGHGLTGCGKSRKPLQKCPSGLKPEYIAQYLSGFDNPLPRTKVRGYTRSSVFPQPVQPRRKYTAIPGF